MEHDPGNSQQRLHPVIMEVPPSIRELGGREKVQALRRHAREALNRSATYSGVALGALEKGDRGQPLPSLGNHWSLSHTTDYVAAVVAPYRIGIDIEKFRPFTEEMKALVGDEHEWRLAPVIDDTLFCRYWTAKEAVLKLVGTGLGGLSQCSIKEITDEHHLLVSYKFESWTVSHCSKAPLHLAAITAPAHQVEWHILEPD